jgi:putative membrane protein insertion efficiency factor
MTSTSNVSNRGPLWCLGWPLRFVLVNLVRGYQKWISSALPPSCRYHPSCSSYAMQSLETHGAAKGLLLTSWRVLKCNPFTEGGLNPVPPKGKWRAEIDPGGNVRAVASDMESDGVDSDEMAPINPALPRQGIPPLSGKGLTGTGSTLGPKLAADSGQPIGAETPVGTVSRQPESKAPADSALKLVRIGAGVSVPRISRISKISIHNSQSGA